MPFFNWKGAEIKPEVFVDQPVAIDLNDGEVAQIDDDHQIKIAPSGSTLKFVDTPDGPCLDVRDFQGRLLSLLHLRPGSVLFGVITDSKKGVQIVDPKTEIRVK